MTQQSFATRFGQVSAGQCEQRKICVRTTCCAEFSQTRRVSALPQNWRRFQIRSHLSKQYSRTGNNCQKFAYEIFEALGLNGDFEKYNGWTGEFLRYIATVQGEVTPCLVDKGHVIRVDVIVFELL